MSRLEWYILRRTAGVTFGTLIAATTIVLITQLLIRVDFLSSTGQSILVFGKLALYLIPSVAVIVVPFALLIGAMQTLNTMNSDSELVVIEASGGSRKIVARPLLVFGLALSVFTFILANFIEPASNRNIRDLITEASADLLSVAVQSGTFTRIDENLIIQIESKERDGSFKGIFIADRRDKDAELLYFAKTGAIAEVDGSKLFVMRDGQLQRSNFAADDVSVISFDLNALDLAAFGQKNKGAFYFPKERSTFDLIAPDPDDDLYKKHPGQLRTELNKRLSEWLYALSFAMFSIFYLGKARSHRQSSFLATIYLVFVVMAVRGVGAFATNNSEHGGAFEILVYAAPIGMMMFFAALIYFDKDMPDPQRTLDIIRKYLQKLRGFLPDWLFKLRFLKRKPSEVAP